MGYVPVMPPGMRVRPIPPHNRRGFNVGAPVPPLRPLYDDRGKVYGWWADKPGEVRAEVRADDWPPFWTPSTVTVAILALCLFSYAIGLWHGQMQGLVIAKAGDQLEKPE